MLCRYTYFVLLQSTLSTLETPAQSVNNQANPTGVSQRAMPPKAKPAPTTTKGESKSKPQKHFRFFDLPAELRNEIYALACTEQQKAYLSDRTHGKLASPLPLLLLSRETRSESLAVLSRVVPEIIATVTNLDFDPIVRFFIKCADVDLDTLRGGRLEGTGALARRIVLRLVLTDESHFYLDRLQLWITRFAKQVKKGSQVRAEYEVIAKSSEHIRRFSVLLRGLEARCQGDRQVDELKRLVSECQRAEYGSMRAQQ